MFERKGKLAAVGSKRSNPALAKFLAAYAKDGPSAFYEGENARAIVKAVQANGGILTLEDLVNYQPTWRTPLHGTYRGLDIITMPPPSSGGVALLETLNVL